MTTRRDLLIALGAGALPLVSFAQQPPKLARIGYLDTVSASESASRADVLRAGLLDLGYLDGRNIVIELRWAEGNYKRLPGLAAELVRLKVDVIVAAGTAAIEAARKATGDIPVVMAATGDPVGLGFVASLSRPGGNITGLSNLSIDVSNKYLELLRLAVPKFSRVAVLMNPDNPLHPNFLRNIQSAAKTAGASVSPVTASTPGEIDAAFAAIRRERAGALIVLLDGLFITQRRQIAELAVKNRVPAIFGTRGGAEAGCLMSYGQDITEHFRRAASYVDKILKGAKPAELPVEQATKIELVINRKTAKALGLAIPQELLLRADRVIE